MARIRIDKYLSHIGKGTRSEVKKLIKLNKVKVNDQCIKDPGYKVDPETDVVMVGNESVGYTEHVYLMLYKPKGLISATTDKKDKTVMDIVDHPMKAKCFPVGRLDKDTTGLLLITNDGDLSHDLLSPKKHVDKTYFALLDHDIAEEHVKCFYKGVVLEDGYECMPADLIKLGDSQLIAEYGLDEIDEAEKDQADPRTWVSITIREGKFHQVKRMFEAIDRKVLELHRHSMGPLILDKGLDIGSNRELSSDEIKLLINR